MEFLNRTKQEVLDALEVIYDANRNTETRKQEKKVDLAIDVVAKEFGITMDFINHMDEVEGPVFDKYENLNFYAEECDGKWVVYKNTCSLGGCDFNPTI